MKTCTECGETKVRTEFYANRLVADGLLNQCKTCVRAKQKAHRQGAGRDAYLARQRAYTAATRDRKRVYDAEYRAANREKLLAAKRAWYQANREHHMALGKVWREANADRRKALDKAYHERYRDELYAAVFGHYGTACACCGETGNLTIDHINGDGKEHRASLNRTNTTGQAFYYWLIRNGFPEGFQALCRPCNVNKGTRERCQLDHARL